MYTHMYYTILHYMCYHTLYSMRYNHTVHYVTSHCICVLYIYRMNTCIVNLSCTANLPMIYRINNLYREYIYVLY